MQRAQDLMFSGDVAEGTITGFNKGGLIVELDGEELKGWGGVYGFLGG
jgi:ribosomal protein S1